MDFCVAVFIHLPAPGRHPAIHVPARAEGNARTDLVASDLPYGCSRSHRRQPGSYGPSHIHRQRRRVLMASDVQQPVTRFLRALLARGWPGLSVAGLGWRGAEGGLDCGVRREVMAGEVLVK